MKKLIAILSILCLFPLSAMALTPMHDSQMSNVTGQAGVTIGIDMNMTMSVDAAAWGDDGIDTDHDGVSDTDGGWVGVSSLGADLYVGLRKDYDTAAEFAVAEFLTIDVATDTTYGDGVTPATYVHIGLGTLEVSGNMNFNFALGNADLTDGVLEQTLGTVTMQNFAVRLGEGGYVDITADGRTGVTLGLGVQIDEINMDLMAWGDSDGIAHLDATGTVVSDNIVDGYIGLAALDIDDVTITGEVGIDVLTVPSATALANLAALVTSTDNAERAVGKLASVNLNNVSSNGHTPMSASMVMLTLGNADGTADASDLVIDMASMSSAIVVGNSVAGNTGNMGSMYVGGVNVQIDGLVAIGAH